VRLGNCRWAEYFDSTGHSRKDIQIAALDHHVDVFGKALVAIMDRRQTDHDCLGDAFFARESLQCRKGLGKLRFLHFMALHGGNHPFEGDHCFRSFKDVHGRCYLLHPACIRSFSSISR
jgi:hypothetical protein